MNDPHQTADNTRKSANADQIAYWNGQAGRKWVDENARLDAFLAPFLPEILHRASLRNRQHVLDVGCGAGSLSLLAARQVGPHKGVTGLDVSRPLLRLAKQRANEHQAPVRLVCADASRYQTSEPVDVMISRFGVMFFDDPKAAFSQLRQNMTPKGRLIFCAWQAPDCNPWAALPLQCAREILPDPPEPPPPGTPGPFALADPTRLFALLDQAGWTDIVIDNWSENMQLPGENIRQNAQFLLNLGPAARLLTDADVDPVVALPRLTDELTTRCTSPTATLPGAAWIVSATTP